MDNAAQGARYSQSIGYMDDAGVWCFKGGQKNLASHGDFFHNAPARA